MVLEVAIVTWEPLPDEFALPDNPVENVQQPALAAKLRELGVDPDQI